MAFDCVSRLASEPPVSQFGSGGSLVARQRMATLWPFGGVSKRMADQSNPLRVALAFPRALVASLVIRP